MDGAVEVLRKEFGGLRTGRASASLLEPVKVTAYGNPVPLNQVASINVPEPRLITVQVWDRGVVKAVDKAIRESGLGLNPQTEGQTIRVPIPELNQERRRELTRKAAEYAEQARVAVRKVRQHGIEAMRKLGAEVRLHGRDFDEARLECERVGREEGMLYVHSANEPKLIAGVGTIGLEILEDLADVDVILVPAGGGSCASGTCIAMKHLKPSLRVIAVQSDAAPAMWHAWRNRNLDPYPTMKTEHEGLATRVPFEMTNRILWELLDDFILVSDEEIRDAIRLLARNAKQVAEGAGAASLAGALKLRDQLHGKKVVGILTGGNIPPERFAAVLNEKAM